MCTEKPTLSQTISDSYTNNHYIFICLDWSTVNLTQIPTPSESLASPRGFRPVIKTNRTQEPTSTFTLPVANDSQHPQAQHVAKSSLYSTIPLSLVEKDDKVLDKPLSIITNLRERHRHGQVVTATSPCQENLRDQGLLAIAGSVPDRPVVKSERESWGNGQISRHQGHAGQDLMGERKEEGCSDGSMWRPWWKFANRRWCLALKI